ncbi:hypothetical protein WMF38_30225 [Sorangium sp. So ce118]
MPTLSWPDVRACFQALRDPQDHPSAILSVAASCGVARSTAKELIDTAVELGLVADTGGQYMLSAFVDRPEDLLLASTLIRLFRVWRSFGSADPDPLRLLPEPIATFHIVGVDAVDVLRSASALAQRAPTIPDALSPQPGLLLEMARLWRETRKPSPMKPLFSSPHAFQVFHALLFTTGIYPDNEQEALDRFVRACRILHNRNLVQLAIVQYPFDRNRHYHRFRTNLGYIKALYDPRPFEGLTYAEPVQEARRRLSSAG